MIPRLSIGLSGRILSNKTGNYFNQPLNLIHPIIKMGRDSESALAIAYHESGR